MEKQINHQTELEDSIRDTMKKEIPLPKCVEQAKMRVFDEIRARKNNADITNESVCEQTGTNILANEITTISTPKKQTKTTKRKQLNKWAVIRRSMTGLTASVALVLCLCNPAFAAKIPLFGNVLVELGEILGFAGDYSDYAKPLEEGADDSSVLNGEFSATVDGVTVALSEVYSNDAALYLSMIIKTDTPFPETLIDSTNGLPCLSLENISVEFDFAADYVIPLAAQDLEGRFIDDYTYAGVMRLEWQQVGGFYAVNNKGAQLEFPKNFNVQISIGKIKGIKLVDNTPAMPQDLCTLYYSRMKEYGLEEYVAEGQMYLAPEAVEQMTQVQRDIEHAIRTDIWKLYNERYPEVNSIEGNAYREYWFDGSWDYEIAITTNHTKSEIMDVNDFNDEGYGLVSITKTPFEIVAEYQHPAKKVSYITVFDAEGKELSSGSSSTINTWSTAGRDTSIVRFYILDWVTYMDLKLYRESDNFETMIAEVAMYEAEITLP